MAAQTLHAALPPSSQMRKHAIQIISRTLLATHRDFEQCTYSELCIKVRQDVSMKDISFLNGKPALSLHGYTIICPSTFAYMSSSVIFLSISSSFRCTQTPPPHTYTHTCVHKKCTTWPTDSPFQGLSCYANQERWKDQVGSMATAVPPTLCEHHSDSLVVLCDQQEGEGWWGARRARWNRVLSPWRATLLPFPVHQWWLPRGNSRY